MEIKMSYTGVTD